MPDDDLIILGGRIKIPSSELTVKHARSGGPGGQNVNKVNTKVEIRFTPAESGAFLPTDKEYLLERISSRVTKAGELIVQSDVHRTQPQNHKACLEKLRGIIEQGLRREKKRLKTKPTKASKERRLAEKRKHAQKKAKRGQVSHED